MTRRLITDELELLSELVPLDRHPRIVELGCGAAQLSRQLLRRFPRCRVVGLEVDERQHAKNLADPVERLDFVQAGALYLVMDADARTRLVDNLAGSLSQVSRTDVIARSISHFEKANAELGARLTARIAELLQKQS